jgi:hypothetical protein
LTIQLGELTIEGEFSRLRNEPLHFQRNPLTDGPKTNQEIRKWYLDELAEIPKLNGKWKREGIPLAERARLAWKYRHDRRRMARSFMQSEVEREQLGARDIAVYDSPNGPTFAFLKKRLSAEGLTENEVFEAIIKGSHRTNAGIDKKLGF